MAKKGKKSNFSLILGVFILFAFTFIILISKQNEGRHGDVYSSLFNVTPIINERMVAKDLNAIYPRYFVVYFDNTDNTYIMHTFNYYQNKNQYDLEFNRLSETIVDYDYENYMIRTIYQKGYGSYNDLLKEIYTIVDTNNLQVF